ncbi:MAG: hypothetical protein COA84_14575 [Robiginitomaculum sp.]|nr:MAG: hypothetical protein COA84_14575 [Robiginitomaculum sp.]
MNHRNQIIKRLGRFLMELDLMLRKLFLTSVALPLLGFASLAHAQVEVTDERTAPIDTGTIDNGSPGDIIIRNGGSVLVGAGPAVTINTDNTVTNEGNIGSSDADNTIGILISGGTTGGFTNDGTINLKEDYTAEDSDGDGDPDGPFAIGTGRTGILVEGSSAFTGDILNGAAGRITIEGNDSAGIRILAGLDGNLTNEGNIALTGANGFAIQIASTVNGDVSNVGTISTVGENTVGIGVEADINGQLINTGTITSSGFRESTRRNSADNRANLDADDLTPGGSAVSIAANVSGGFLNGRVLNSTGAVISFGRISSIGSAPAVLVTAGVDGEAGGDVTLGAVGTETNVDDFGLVNDGDITATGINDGFVATAILVQGQDVGGTMRRAIIENGILNNRFIFATSFDATSRAIWVGDGGVVDTVRNSATIRSAVISQAGHQAIGLAVDTGGTVNTVFNNGSIEASFTGSGTGSQAVAIFDASGTLDLIENEGQITAVYIEVLPNGEEADPNDNTRRTVAIDVSANTSGVTLTQNVNSNPDSAFIPAIRGDVLLGSGDDVVELNAGTVDGDIVFGDGADLLTVDGGAEVTGALYDSDGLLTLDIRDGTLALGSGTTLSLTDATFGADALLQMTLSGSANGIIGATFDATGSVVFVDGATIAPILDGLIGDGGAFSFLHADTLTIGGTFDALLNADQLPFLYNVDLRQGAGNTLVLDLRRRTASELGFDANQSAAYDAWFTALSASSDSALESGFAQLTTADDFYAAYNQLLPEFGAAALQFTLANTDGTTGAVASRLDNVRRGYGEQGGLWVEEIGYYMSRNLSSITQPYRGFGLGLAIGIDRPLGPFEAVGIAISGFSNEIKQPGSFDKPLTSKSAQLGIYAGGKFGGANFETHTGFGLDDFNSERVLEFGDVSRTSLGSWSGRHIASTTRLSYDFMAGKWFIRPGASLDYLWLKENSYLETGGGSGIDLDINARTSKSFSGTATITFGRRYGSTKASWWSPRLRLGIRNEFQGNAASTVARFSGFTDEFTLTPQALPKTAALLGLSFTAGSQFTSFGLDYDVDIRNGFIRQTGRLVIRFIF